MDTQSRVPARKLSEWLDVDYRTAWYMRHRIRRLLADPNWDKLSGIVEADGHAVGAPRRQGFIGLFRRRLQGTWHWVSRKHLDAYTTKCTWRHNLRHVSRSRKFIQALGGLDTGPLGYHELVACG